MTLTALTGCWPSGGSSSSEQTKNAVKTALKAAVEQNEDSYNLVKNKARTILEAYLEKVEAGYTDVYNPLNVIEVYQTEMLSSALKL